MGGGRDSLSQSRKNTPNIFKVQAEIKYRPFRVALLDFRARQKFAHSFSFCANLGLEVCGIPFSAHNRPLRGPKAPRPQGPRPHRSYARSASLLGPTAGIVRRGNTTNFWRSPQICAEREGMLKHLAGTKAQKCNSKRAVLHTSLYAQYFGGIFLGL